MAAEVVHEQIVGVVHEEVQGIQHVSVIYDPWYFDSLFNELFYLVLSLLFVLDEFHTFLLLLFLEEVRGLLHHLLSQLADLLYLGGRGEEGHIVSGIVLSLLLS